MNLYTRIHKMSNVKTQNEWFRVFVFCVCSVHVLSGTAYSHYLFARKYRAEEAQRTFQDNFSDDHENFLIVHSLSTCRNTICQPQIVNHDLTRR